jgi:Domain of unknown function (DUF4267)
MTSNEIISPSRLTFWLVLAAGALQLINAGRAFFDPAGFATYLGMPLADPGDAALVHVYALRALFIGVLVLALLVTKQHRALTFLAFAAIIMPVGDALLASGAGAPTGTITRHAAIAGYLLVTAILLRRTGNSSF